MGNLIDDELRSVSAELAKVDRAINAALLGKRGDYDELTQQHRALTDKQQQLREQLRRGVSDESTSTRAASGPRRPHSISPTSPPTPTA